MTRPQALALAGLLCWPAAASAQSPAQKQKPDVKTLVASYALEVTPEYLGMANKKTVIRLRLSSPELSKAASSRGVRAVTGEVRGTFASAGQVVDRFRYPVRGDVEGGKTFTYSFLRAVPPGPYHVQLFFNDPGARQVGKAEVDLFVPEIGTVFRPEMAPADASTLPEAEAIVLADSAANATPGGSEPKLKILAPDREAPLGLLRLTAEIEPPITKVEFYLDERLLVARNRPPYSVEIDLSSVPRRQTLRAVGYDESGAVIDEDAYAINEGSARVAVRVLPTPDLGSGNVRVKVAVQSIGGAGAKQARRFLGAEE